RSRPLNHAAPCFGARSITQRYNSSSSASAFFASSTWYAMLASEPVEHLPRRPRSPRLHIRKPALNALDGFHAFDELLVRFSILHDDFRLAIDRQHKRIAGPLEAFEQFRGIALEIAE